MKLNAIIMIQNEVVIPFDSRLRRIWLNIVSLFALSIAVFPSLAIQGGAEDDPLRHGVVRVGSCSGILLNRQWAVTARHCFLKDKNNKNSPYLEGSIYDAVKFGGLGTPKEIESIYLHPDSDVDVALVRLLNPFDELDGVEQGHVKALSEATVDSLIGERVECFGFGEKDPGSTRGEGRASETLRSGVFTMFPNSDTLLRTEPNGSYRTIEGDSGGPCLLREPIPGVRLLDTEAGYTLAGVLSTSALMAPTESFSEWVKTVMSSYQIRDPSGACLGFKKASESGFEHITITRCDDLSAAVRWRIIHDDRGSLNATLRSVYSYEDDMPYYTREWRRYSRGGCLTAEKTGLYDYYRLRIEPCADHWRQTYSAKMQEIAITATGEGGIRLSFPNVDRCLSSHSGRLALIECADQNASAFYLSASNVEYSIQENEKSVAYNALSGEYLVAYIAGDTSSVPSDVGFEVYIRRFASDGSVLNRGTLVSFSGREPSLTYNEDRNEFLLVYVAPHPDGRTMYSQRLDAAGDPLGSRQEVIYDRHGGHNPIVVYNSVEPGYFVVWGQTVEDAITPYHLQSDIYGQRLAADGSKSGGEIPISTWGYSQVRPQVSFNSTTNQFLVVWEDHHWGWGNASDIYGRLLGADGTPLGSSFGIAWERSNRRENPVVAFNSLSNTYLVAYEYEYSENDHDIYLRQVSSTGALNGNETPLAISWESETRPAITFNDHTGENLVAWQYAYSATNQDIQGQFMMSDGFPSGSKFWIAQSERSEMSPILAINERHLDGQRIFYQFEYSTIDTEIRSRKVLHDGSPAP